MFPDPVARVMRRIGGLFGGKRQRERDSGEPTRGDQAWSDLDPTRPPAEPLPPDPPAADPRES